MATYQDDRPPQYQPYNQTNNQNQADPRQPLTEKATNYTQGEEYRPGQWRDKKWAFLFYAHFFVMVGIFAWLGGALMDEIRDETAGGGGEPTAFNIKETVICFLVAAISGGVFAAIWINIMKKIRIYYLVCIYVGMMCVTTLISLLYARSMIMALINIFFLLIIVVWFYLVRRRIPFSEAMLRSAIGAIEANNGPIYLAFCLVVFQFLWVAFWGFTVMSIYFHLNPDMAQPQVKGINNFFYFLLLVSLYWVGQVIKNVGHVTTAGVVASWWLTPGSKSNTLPALKRALTTSFGSICFGSLIVAVLQATRAILRQAREQAARNNEGGAACVLCCIDCILQQIERMVEFFNLYAYTQVAIYGKDFMTAAKHTWDLFKSRGFDLLINSDLTGMVLALGCILGGVVSAVVCAIVGYSLNSENTVWWGVMAAVGFVIGFLMTALVMGVITSAVATTFVLWAEDPEKLSRGQPDHYRKIDQAARDLHPSWTAVV